MTKEELTNEEEVIVEEKDIEEVEEPKQEKKIERGIVVFEGDDGLLHYQAIGQVNIENITYYEKYLSKVVDQLWGNIMKEGQ